MSDDQAQYGRSRLVLAAIEDLEAALKLPESTLRLIVEQVVERLKEAE